jgi:hypothetical protein
MRSTILQDALSPSAKRLHHCSISPTAWPFYSAKSHNCRSQSADIAVNIIRFTKAVKAFRCFKTSIFFGTVKNQKTAVSGNTLNEA